MSQLSIAIEEDNDSDENPLFEPTEGEEEHSGGGRKPPKRSMRRAINEMCMECTYDPKFRGGGTWREQTGACAITKCPLWEFRPVSKPHKVKEVEA